MFENKLDKKYGIHYSRYIMSWIITNGGKKYFSSADSAFGIWLRDHLKLDEEDICEILNMGSNGKLELQTSAKAFYKAFTEEES